MQQEVEIVEDSDIEGRYSLSWSAHKQALWVDAALEFLEWVDESIEAGTYPPPLGEMRGRIIGLQDSAA